MNFKNYHVWSRDCHRVPNLLLCTKFHRNWIIFRPDMAISRFSRWRISAISNFRRSNNGFFEKPTKRTSYRSSIKTIALNCLVFEKIAFFCVLATNRHTDKRTNRWTVSMHKALAVASGALIKRDPIQCKGS